MIIWGHDDNAPVLGASTRPKHRRTMSTHGEPTYAECIDPRYYYDGGCIEDTCPRHDPTEYAAYEARHRAEED